MKHIILAVRKFLAVPKRKLTLVLAVGTLALAGVLVPTPAHAVNGLYDVCQSGTSICWRATGTSVFSTVDAWARDISGDSLQRFTPVYEGAVTSSWPYTNASLDAGEKGDGVYIYQFANSQAPPNSCAVGYLNYTDVNIQNCGATGHLFVWQSNGCIVNVYVSDYFGYYISILDSAEYNPLQLTDCTQWVTVDPPK